MENSNGKVIASAGSKKNMLVFTLGEYKDRRTLDIRKFFFSKKDGEFCPTRKGITLAEKTFRIVKNILDEHDSEISEWLDTEEDVPEEVRKELEAQEASAEAVRYQAHEHEREIRDWRSPEFFRATAKGGTEKLVYNGKHAFAEALGRTIAQLESAESTDEAQKQARFLHILVDQLVLSYVRAKRLFDDAPVVSSEMLFAMLEFNWGCILQNWINAEEGGNLRA